MTYYFDKSLFGWAIKDSFSKYIYANDLACNYFNTSSKEIIGCSDIDLVPNIGEFYKYIWHDDQRIISSQKMSVVLKIFDYSGQGKLKAFLVEKRPWDLADASSGIICTYMELTNVYFSTFFSQHCRKPIVFTKPSTVFTDREWEAILLLLCGVKRDLISEILGISALTLRNRIIRCCEKAQVHNVTALVEYCYCHGWDNYIPPFFLKKGYVTLV